MFEKLLKEIEYAKTATFKRQSLYHEYGRITMARELGAITQNEYMELNHACVYDGINNPKHYD
ncbi:MAG: hypothetical protein FWE91_08445 [Defluviitaleaceae bacterium]|nr:hypothetical protein [Defluviitaleaceae bacterium]MCL2835283.1 hypothetical protein [Defluviitaleaceae bacterium]